MIRELLKVGTWTGGKVTRKIIKQVIRNFSDTDRAPIIKGHNLEELEQVPSAAKTLGWVSKLWTDENLTTAIGKVDLNEEGTQAYFGGFENCSAGLRQNPQGEWYLHHLGLLSAVPPSVKGLKVLEYADEGGGYLVYSGKGRMDIIVPTDRMLQADTKEKSMAEQTAPEKEDTELFKLRQHVRKQHKIIRALKKQLSESKTTTKEQEQKLQNHADMLLQEKKELLKKAASGKIPKAKLDALLSLTGDFPDKVIHLSDNAEADLFSLLTEIFSGMTKQMQEGEINLGDVPENTGEVIPVTDYINNV